MRTELEKKKRKLADLERELRIKEMDRNTLIEKFGKMSIDDADWKDMYAIVYLSRFVVENLKKCVAVARQEVAQCQEH